MIEVSLILSFPTSNNQEEYEAILARLRLAEDVRVKEIGIFIDSQLIASQVFGEYQVKNNNLVEYLTLVRGRIVKFKSARVRRVPREHNTRADILSKLASTQKKGGNKFVIQELLPRLSIEKPTATIDIYAIIDATCWMTLVYKYLANNKLPHYPKEAVTVRRRA